MAEALPSPVPVLSPEQEAYNRREEAIIRFDDQTAAEKEQAEKDHAVAIPAYEAASLADAEKRLAEEDRAANLLIYGIPESKDPRTMATVAARPGILDHMRTDPKVSADPGVRIAAASHFEGRINRLRAEGLPISRALVVAESEAMLERNSLPLDELRKKVSYNEARDIQKRSVRALLETGLPLSEVARIRAERAADQDAITNDPLVKDKLNNGALDYQAKVVGSSSSEARDYAELKHQRELDAKDAARVKEALANSTVVQGKIKLEAKQAAEKAAAIAAEAAEKAAKDAIRNEAMAERNKVLQAPEVLSNGEVISKLPDGRFVIGHKNNKVQIVTPGATDADTKMTVYTLDPSTKAAPIHTIKISEVAKSRRNPTSLGNVEFSKDEWQKLLLNSWEEVDPTTGKKTVIEGTAGPALELLEKAITKRNEAAKKEKEKAEAQAAVDARNRKLGRKILRVATLGKKGKPISPVTTP